MKIISADQTKWLDQYTIEKEPISSIDLMERASLAFVEWFVNAFPEKSKLIYIFCGPGNNGGDGLAIGRLLTEKGYSIEIVICEISKNKSKDFTINYDRLDPSKLTITSFEKGTSFPKLKEKALVIDAIFGTGLNRIVEDYWADFLSYLNDFDALLKIAVDLPSGMFADQMSSGISFKADHTIAFELPKLAFMLPENFERIGEWTVQKIGLHPEGLAKLETSHHYINQDLIKSIYRKRKKFAHKGTYGHALLIVGSEGMMGAAILAAKACLRSGVGLLTVHSPKVGHNILQTTIPEAIVSQDPSAKSFSTLPIISKYKVVGIGCGIGKRDITKRAVHDLLSTTDQYLVLDADALNIISEESWQDKIPKGSVLTPHPKEFERLFGKVANDFERLEVLRQFAQQLGIHIVLKGAHTAIGFPDGSIYFNSTGNPGMATAGSGDVLTGIITALISQGYLPSEAAILGVYLHGLAGDLAAEALSEEAMIAGDLIQYLGKSYLKL